MRKGAKLIALVCMILLIATTVAFASGEKEKAQQAEAEKIVVGVGGWAVDPTKQAMEELEFTEQTGIEVEVTTRPGAPPEFKSQMTSAIMGGTTPYDVVDLEDDAAIPFSRSGWLMNLDPLFDDEFWQDWPDAMLEMIDTWHRYNGELFRIPHNYEAQYFWYRKDLFDQKGLQPPETWQEMVQVGRQMKTDTMWGVCDGLAKGGYLSVYVSYLTLQAGGNPFNWGEPMRSALQFMHDMIYEHEVMPKSDLNKDYDQVNSDYMNDRCAMMRQWPYFYDVARGNEEWYEEGKAAIALPPAGPAERVTFAASWGWSIPKETEKPEAAKTFVKFMNSRENAPKLAQMSTWFLNARDSVLEAMGNEGMAQYLKMYSDAGVIGTRPFHPKFAEAKSIVGEVVSSYLTNQISLDEAMQRGRQRMQDLEEE